MLQGVNCVLPITTIYLSVIYSGSYPRTVEIITAKKGVKVKKAGNDKCLHHPEYVGCAQRSGVASLDVAVMVN